MHTEYCLKASEMNGKTSVGFGGWGPDVGKETIRGVTQGAATTWEVTKGESSLWSEVCGFPPIQK